MSPKSIEKISPIDHVDHELLLQTDQLGIPAHSTEMLKMLIRNNIVYEVCSNLDAESYALGQ